jgi:hypothetical protein
LDKRFEIIGSKFENMGTISRFEDLEIWKKARVFSKEIFELTMENGFEKDFSLRNQINSSSGSIADNIAEVSSAKGTKNLSIFSVLRKAQLVKPDRSSTEHLIVDTCPKKRFRG